mmetsp:Transcript_12919/g.26701  ORF Transcript_12919/g.26701 Transcript_12919/m.26701 type:complete len:215 (-) Transcript_12919:513-1157(-)
MLNVKLATVERVLHFPGDGIIDLELSWSSIIHHCINLFLVKQSTAGRDAKDQPSSTAKHMPCNGILHKQSVQKCPKRRDASTSSNHDNIIIGILGKEHGLTDRSGNVHGRTGQSIAQEVAAHALLGRVGNAGIGIVVLRPAHAKTNGRAVQRIAVSSRCNGVQPWFVRSAGPGIRAGGDNAQTLTFDVVHALGEPENNVLNVTGRFGRNDALPG